MLFSAVHLVHVNHHQPMKRFLAPKCCSIQPRTISISSIFNTWWTQTQTSTCRIIHHFIIRCKDQSWTVASKYRRYHLSNVNRNKILYICSGALLLAALRIFFVFTSFNFRITIFVIHIVDIANRSLSDSYYLVINYQNVCGFDIFPCAKPFSI